MHVCVQLNILNNLCSHNRACKHTLYAHRNTQGSLPSSRYASIWICSLWPAGWKVSFSHWERCQFSFHYSTMGLNPHYHNKLYFYRHVQTEAAFQGIRLNFIWPPVFLGNTVLPQLLHLRHPPTHPFSFSFSFFCIWNMLLTEYHIFIILSILFQNSCID